LRVLPKVLRQACLAGFEILHRLPASATQTDI
jgi:hypothetical protein